MARWDDRLLRTLFLSSPIGLYIVQDGRFLLVNPEFRKSTGYTDEELLGMDSLDLVIPEDRDMVREKAIKMIKRELSSPYEFRVLNREGHLHWIMESVTSFLYKGRRATLGNFMDITQRKRAEEALLESEEKYKALFEDSRDAIYITSREGLFLDVNQAAVKLFGYTREEMIGLNAREIYADASDRQRFQEEVEAKSSVRDYEVKFRKKDGTEMDCLLTSSLRRLKDGRILGYQGIIRDITERKRAERERERLIWELQDALSKVKKLSGLLPICASCKKIRDNKGYWNQLEVFISEHSEVDFSHSLCPDCVRKIYPNYFRSEEQ